MAKIYVQTIILVITLVILILLRLHLLAYDFVLPDIVLDVPVCIIIVAIVINEKFTKGEHWGFGQRLALFFAFFAILYLRLQLGWS